MARKSSKKMARNQSGDRKVEVKDRPRMSSPLSLGAAAVNGAASTVHTESDDTKHDGAPQNAKKKMNWELWLAASIAIFAGIQALVSYWQWSAMAAQNDLINKQIKQTDSTLDQMRLEQRAWLGAGQPELEPFVVGEKIKCVASFRNTGNTPAMVVETKAAPLVIPGEVDGLNFQPDMKTMEGLPVRNVVSPDGVLHVTDDETQVMTQEMLDNLASGKEKLWVFVRAYYRDALEGKLRRTRLYFVWDPKTKRLYAHDKGNEMT